MDKFNNFLNTPIVRFAAIAILFFIILRSGLALINDTLTLSSGLSTLLAVLLSGLGAYKITWRR